MVDELGVPVLHEAVMRIELQKPVLHAVHRHDLGTRPAHAAAFTPIDIEDLETRIPGEGQRRFFGTVLPADPEAKIARPRRFRETVFDGRDELGIPVGSDGNEDHVPYCARPPGPAGFAVPPPPPRPRPATLGTGYTPMPWYELE